MQNIGIYAGARAPQAPVSRMSEHDQQELLRRQRKQDQQRRALDRVTSSKKRKLKAEQAAAARTAKMEMDKVKLLQQTMTARMDKAKLEAHNISLSFKDSVRKYVESHVMRPEEIGWLQQLQDRIGMLPNGLAGKNVKNATPARVRSALRRAVVNPSNKAWSTKKFGAGAPTAAFFNGDTGVGLGFSIGKEPQTYDTSEHVGIDFGSEFAYTTSIDASDNTVSSEYVKLRLFRSMGLVRFRVDATKVISAAMQTALRDLNASCGEHLEWQVPIECWGKVNLLGGVGDAENGYASGLYFGVYKYKTAEGAQQSTRIIIGYWGLVGMRLAEISAAAYGAFDVTEANADDLGTSCLLNLVRSGDPMLEHREFSLRGQQNAPEQKAQLVKNSLGYFIVVEPIDRRAEFEYFQVAGTLPLELTSDYIGDLSLLHKYGGRIVFTDFANKMIHYYTGGGALRVRMFNDAAPLNDYDFVDLHTRSVVLDRSAVSETLIDARAKLEAGKVDDIEGVVLEHLEAWNKLADDEGVQPTLIQTGSVPSELNVSVEMLRTSYNGSRILYNLVRSYYSAYAVEKAVDLVKGYTFVGETDDDNLAALAQKMALPQMRVMLHLATVGEHEFPKLATAQAAVEKHQHELNNPKLDIRTPGLGQYLNEHNVAEFFKTQPHQVRAFGMAVTAPSGVWDVDMGGGKTLLSILWFIYWIEHMRSQGIKPRALIVMPDQLVTNYYREAKKFTRRDPKNPEAGSRLNVITLRSKNSRMNKVFTQNEIMDKLAAAPDNTIIVASYSWISSDYVKINTGEYRVNDLGERVYKYEYMFPRAEALCQRAGVNMVILDESHKIKNNGEGRGFAHKACMALSRVQHKFLMTGTFISKNPQDMFNQVKFINPTLLGSVADFRKRYTTENGQWNHATLKDLRRYIAARGVITMRREEWLYQMPRKTERFHFADFKLATPELFKIYSTLWEATNKEFPAEFAEMLGGGRARVDNDESGDSAVDALDSAEDELAEEQALKDLNTDGLIGDSKAEAEHIVKSPVGARLQALRALVSAPERFPVFSEAMRKVSSLLKFDPEALLKGPKDDVVVKLCRDHFAETLGDYVPPSKQDGPEDKHVGKIAIVCDRVLIAKHFQRVLTEAGFKTVGYYDASHREGLEAFCDPEDTSLSIMCMVENSVREGINGQSISRIIKATIPWTTGDYDQVIARAFRIGQRKHVFVDNVLCMRSFEPAQLARLISRENVNKKVSSDFDSVEWMEEITINPEIAHPETGLIGENDLRHYSYGAGEDKREVDLLELHEAIYQYELRRSVAWRYSYLAKLVDSVEMQERNPGNCVYKQTDLRQQIHDSVPGTSHPFGCPAEVYFSENQDLENKIVYVDAERRIGIMYLRSQKHNGKLEYVRIQFYELEPWNDRAVDTEIAGSHVAYEPWPTHGIRPEEMAEVEVDEATVEEIESRNERECEGIGHNGIEAKLRQRIIKEIRVTADSGVDVNLAKFLEGRVLAADSKLVSAVYAAVWEGKYDPIFVKSAGMYSVYVKVSKAAFARNDNVENITAIMSTAAARYRDEAMAKLQARTGVSAEGLPQGAERVLPGPVLRNDTESIGYMVGFGEMDGSYTLVIPQHRTNLDLGAPTSLRGWSKQAACMSAVVGSEPAFNALVDGIIRSGLQIQNLEMFSEPTFKFALARCIGANTPDQTASLSILSAFATAGTGVRLAYTAVEKTMLITAEVDEHAPVLADAGFRKIPPYLYKHVTKDTIADVLASLQGVRYKTALSSRIYSILRVRAQARNS